MYLKKEGPGCGCLFDAFILILLFIFIVLLTQCLVEWWY